MHPVNLGYATFDSGSNGPMVVVAISDGALVAITNDEFAVRITAPFNPSAGTNSPASLAGYARRLKVRDSPLVEFIEGRSRDAVKMRMGLEETKVHPITNMALMSNNEFRLFLIAIAFKAHSELGHREVCYFTTPHIKALVQVGYVPYDPLHAMVFLNSLDATKYLLMMCELNSHSTGEIVPRLEPILGSFRFTIDKVGDHEATARLISEAGIPKWSPRKSDPSD